MKSLMFASLIIMITNTASPQKYLFYLHGAIVEGQGDNATNSFGTYKYTDIINAFRKENFIVMDRNSLLFNLPT